MSIRYYPSRYRETFFGSPSSPDLEEFARLSNHYFSLTHESGRRAYHQGSRCASVAHDVGGLAVPLLRGPKRLPEPRIQHESSRGDRRLRRIRARSRREESAGRNHCKTRRLPKPANLFSSTSVR